MELQETPIAKSRLPIWAWWVIGIALIIAVAAGIVLIIRNTQTELPPGLIERRKDISRILEDIDRVEDVDIKPLVELEKVKDYKGAVALMERAVDRNAEYEKLVASLANVSDELAKLSVQVRPDDLGSKAVEAFGFLVRLAEAERKFYEDRRALYEITLSYYTDLETKKNPTIPENLHAVVEAVNSDLQKVKEASQQFAIAVKAFDDAASGK